ncbi:MAG: hypothetical protein Hyperionvirus4_8 [Hyperionvirus sp.]|uniref:Uncharacterized protein n=1 Tax=Hyperionvirus sp. TaxID=2487770 RepID=A0A3G5AB32_9VIRU|nr:MAG: hypothetical protein Hyperionvirus4_8 [Hyperionvirus sp.]
MTDNIPDAARQKIKIGPWVLMPISIVIVSLVAKLCYNPPDKDNGHSQRGPLKDWRCDSYFSCHRFKDCPNYENIYIRVYERDHSVNLSKAADIDHAILYYGDKINSICLDSIGLITQENIKEINPNNINICNALFSIMYLNVFQDRIYMQLVMPIKSNDTLLQNFDRQLMPKDPHGSEVKFL